MSTAAMKNIIYRSTDTEGSLNILYDPSYSLFDTAIFDALNANFYCYDKLGMLNKVPALSDFGMIPYDFILTNKLHSNYENISHSLHIPIIRYVGFEIGPNIPKVPNTYYVSETATQDHENFIFSIDPIDLSNYCNNIEKTKDACVIINYPEMNRSAEELLKLLKTHCESIDIVQTSNNDITVMSQYKCVIDPYPNDQYNMIYAITNRSAYICKSNSIPAILGSKLRSIYPCENAKQIIDAVSGILHNYNNIPFDADKSSFILPKSNWKEKIKTVCEIVKSKGYIR